MSYFKGKTVWVTGASSGLGEALCKALARYGANVVLSARRKDELDRVAEECAKSGSGSFMVLPLDAGNLKNADELTSKVIEKFGRIDILINNAGIGQRAYVHEAPHETERQIMEVNYFGVVTLTRAVLAQMKKQGGGSIVAISSIMGKMGYPGRSSYSSSKHALHGYYESLRIEEHQNNIQVQIICPGYIKTNVSLNAVTKTGSSHKKMDKGQSRGMSADKAAQIVLNAIKSGKFETIFGGAETGAITLKRFMPGLFFRLILGRGKKKDF